MQKASRADNFEQQKSWAEKKWHATASGTWPARCTSAIWARPRPSTRSKVPSASTDSCATSGLPGTRPVSRSSSLRTNGTLRTRAARWTDRDAAEHASGWKCPREGPGETTEAGVHGARTDPVRRVAPGPGPRAVTVTATVAAAAAVDRGIAANLVELAGSLPERVTLHNK